MLARLGGKVVGASKPVIQVWRHGPRLTPSKGAATTLERINQPGPSLQDERAMAEFKLLDPTTTRTELEQLVKNYGVSN